MRILFYNVKRFKELIEKPNFFDFIFIFVTVDLRKKIKFYPISILALFMANHSVL